jgi:hypothetical protein
MPARAHDHAAGTTAITRLTGRRVRPCVFQMQCSGCPLQPLPAKAGYSVIPPSTNSVAPVT